MGDSRGMLTSFKPRWKYWRRRNENLYESPYVSEKRTWSLPPIDLGWTAEPVIRSFENIKHRPGGGLMKIYTQRLYWGVEAKVGSLENRDYNRNRTSQNDPLHESWIVKPESYEHIGPKVGSLDNLGHVPGGGDVKIHQESLHWIQKPKVGSLENIHYKPKRGFISIANDRPIWRAKSKVGSFDNIKYQPKITQGKVLDRRLAWNSSPRVGSLDNMGHVPGGGNVVIPRWRLRWKARSKVNSLPHNKSPVDNLSFRSR